MSSSSHLIVPSRRSFLALASAAMTVAACSRAPASNAGPLSVFAAASLQEAIEAAISAFAAAGHGAAHGVYAGSSQLARQIEQGAPADLFISADLEWMDWLQARSLIDPVARHNIAGNRLVLVAPVSGNTSALDLAPDGGLTERVLARLGDGRLATAEPDVPAGRYARQALTGLDLWTALEPRLAPAENVRAALALVARGEAPLGVVYATDAQADLNVVVVAWFADHLHSPIVYPAAPVVRSGGPAGAATSFLEFLAGAEGQAILRRHGFSPPP